MAKRTSNSKTFAESLKEAYLWFEKIDYLKSEIKLLSKTNYPVIQISGFLLKTQLIEFELKQLITSLNQHIFLSNKSKVLNIKTKKPVDLDSHTLGELKIEIDRYNGVLLNRLKPKLGKLNQFRKIFAHHVFGTKSKLEDLVYDSENGHRIADEVLKEIEAIEKVLEDRDPLRVYLTRND